ncbi:hypothetical protein PVAG01_02257 [Phlyctema vagabunda]|uniref:PUM-HD domain-containing protein n=1 Tax=Phlyctema vagabunda TaxID=108571 RepID=A0ABR4PRE5_9HELO
MSTTTNRPAGAMTSAARSTRFGDFNSAPGRQNSEDRTSQTNLGPTLGNGTQWQASSGIWGNNISSGFGNSKRDASRPRAVDNDSFPDGPSGSGALAASSEAEIWSKRTPWNQPDTTSPTLHASGSTSPTRVRNQMPGSTPQTLLELQQPYHTARPVIGHGKTFSRTQPKSGLDPSSGSFTSSYAQKPAFGYTEDKENYGQESPYDGDGSSRPFRLDQIGSQNSGYLAISGSASRDGSMPPSRASDSALNGLNFGASNPSFTSFGHTPASSIHSQRPSFSGASGSFSQPNGSRFSDLPTQGPDADVRDKFSGLAFRDMEASASQANTNYDSAYSPSQSNFSHQNFQTNGWTDSAKGFNPYAQEYNPPPFAEQGYGARAPRFGDRGSVSPAGSDYRRGLDSPKYSDQLHRPASQTQRIPQGPSDINQRLHSIHIAQQQAQAYLYNTGYPSPYPPQTYDYSHSYRTSNLPYNYPVQIPPFPSAQAIPTRPAKDQDIGANVRSVLLEEFRANTKGSKKYDLKDIYNHVVEFSGDQHGSRFIQQKLETANSDEKEQVFREIQPNALQLMTDVFGNYVIQKMFEHGNQVQKRLLADYMKNHVIELSLQMYGCRVVQKALEHVLADQQAELVKELRADILKCVKDQNGNHVVQKAIERVPREHIMFIIEAFKGQVQSLAVHAYGCRVIQRILEYCSPADQVSILEELHECFSTLITDQYGNYVSQHVIEHGKPEDRSKVIKIVTAQILPLSKHKFASNVVEKSIQFGTDQERKAIVSQLTALHSDGTSPVQLMMKDQYGNYVIQKLLAQLKAGERDAFVEDLKPQLIALKKYNYGKQIAAIEKLIFTGPPNYAPQVSEDVPKSSGLVNGEKTKQQGEKQGAKETMSYSQAAGPSMPTRPIEIDSSAPTPSLTMGQNSPQSSSLPSTNVSTVDEPTENSTDGGQTYSPIDKLSPDVVIKDN